jgi:serine/threonine-protein kinase
MAFEQAGGGKITPMTDIWPLGLIGYFLLTGTHYWRAATAQESTLTMLFGEVISMPIDPPSMRAREQGISIPISPAFDTWFSRCVNRDQAQRYQTAGEMAEALADALGAPPNPGFATMAGGQRLSIVDPPTAAIARTAAGAAPALGTSVPSLSRTNVDPAPPAKSSGGKIAALLAIPAVLLIGAVVVAVVVMGKGKPKTEVSSAASDVPTTAATASATSAVTIAPAVTSVAQPAVTAPTTPATSATAATTTSTPDASATTRVAGPMPGGAKPGGAKPGPGAAAPPPKPAGGKPAGDLYGDR